MPLVAGCSIDRVALPPTQYGSICDIAEDVGHPGDFAHVFFLIDMLLHAVQKSAKTS